MNKNKTIFSLGAYDRFNYGDILFPIISKNFFELNYPTLNFECYALKESDFSKYGGLPTKSIRRLHESNDLKDGDTIFFTGGGTLGSDWYNMHANLLGYYGNKILYYASRIIGNEKINKISRLYFGGKSEFPWIADADDFDKNLKIIYNSVGGSELGTISEKRRTLAIEKLSRASYLSFRDKETANVCKQIESECLLNVAPDSAILMSEQYPIDILFNKINPNLRNTASNKKYVCFHANYSYLKKNISEITNQLEKIYREHNLETILLPIGRYVGLDDHIGLRELLNKLSTPALIISEEASIWDIMYTIANASLFIGTSLHGNVTSQSFGVPHIGLSGKKSKLDFYLNTWGIDGQSNCSNIKDASMIATNILNIPASVRMQNRDQLIKLATNNFHKIAEIILN